MVVENPIVADGSTYGHFAATLARYFYDGTLTDYVVISVFPVCEIEPSFIQEDTFMRSLHGVQFKHSLCRVKIEISFVNDRMTGFMSLYTYASLQSTVDLL